MRPWIVVPFVFFFGFVTTGHSSESRLREGVIRVEAIDRLVNINGKWEEIGAGCIDLNRSRLASYYQTIGERAQTLEFRESSYSNSVSFRYGNCGISTSRGTVKPRSLAPTLTVDFTQHSKSDESVGSCGHARSFSNYRPTDVELYRAEEKLLMASPKTTAFCRARPGTTYVVFWRQSDEVYAF